ncbi:MAG: hypothetical protein ACON5A_00115 [Candidatus Comchoanobacterales bacterium]
MFNLIKSRAKNAAMLCGVALLPVISFADAAKSAGTDNKGLTGAATGLKAFLDTLPGLIGSLALVAGLILFVGGIFTFKQHRDNPTQVPIGKPITQLCLSIVLIFMGNLLAPIATTLFGVNDAKDPINSPKSSGSTGGKSGS